MASNQVDSTLAIERRLETLDFTCSSVSVPKRHGHRLFKTSSAKKNRR